jgi:hypothetical protein
VVEQNHSREDQEDIATQAPTSPQTKIFELPFLSIVFRAKRANILPTTEDFFFCSLEYSRAHVLGALELLDTSSFDCGNQVDCNRGRDRRTETCLLRLINIIMGDVYYERLIGESKANPRRGKIYWSSMCCTSRHCKNVTFQKRVLHAESEISMTTEQNSCCAWFTRVGARKG